MRTPGFGLIAMAAMAAMVAVGCGDRTPSPVPPSSSTAPSASSASSAAAPHHAAPGCPLLPLPPMASDGRREGIEGEDRIAKPPHGDRCATADSNLERVEKAI